MSFWKDKIVVITGGSAGLGLAIAEEFGKQGAILILLSRNQDNLTAAVEHLANRRITAHGMPADALIDDQMESAVADVVRRFGRIDVWVNNVGQSTRVGIREATPHDYRELIEMNLMTAVRCSRLVLPHLEKSSGHLVNIGSLSSKTAWPFLGPYTASKFALAGYTAQLRIEGPKNVHFLLACPGPIQREDAGQRYHGGRHSLPGHALEPGAGARLDGLHAQTVARGIVTACRRRRGEVIMPWRAKILFIITSISPGLADWILRRLIR